MTKRLLLFIRTLDEVERAAEATARLCSDGQGRSNPGVRGRSRLVAQSCLVLTFNNCGNLRCGASLNLYDMRLSGIGTVSRVPHVEIGPHKRRSHLELGRVSKSRFMPE